MVPTIISKKASNWVDRGEPPHPVLRRVLAHFFERLEPEHAPWLDEQVLIILGMVAADATEVHITGYLRSVVQEQELTTREPSGVRVTAVALWHITKAAMVRDQAERIFQELPLVVPTNDSLGHWLASRLLSADDLRRFEREGEDSES